MMTRMAWPCLDAVAVFITFSLTHALKYYDIEIARLESPGELQEIDTSQFPVNFRFQQRQVEQQHAASVRPLLLRWLWFYMKYET